MLVFVVFDLVLFCGVMMMMMQWMMNIDDNDSHPDVNRVCWCRFCGYLSSIVQHSRLVPTALLVMIRTAAGALWNPSESAVSVSISDSVNSVSIIFLRVCM